MRLLELVFDGERDIFGQKAEVEEKKHSASMSWCGGAKSALKVTKRHVDLIAGLPKEAERTSGRRLH